VNDQEENNFDVYENNEVVQEIYETDINMDQPNSMFVLSFCNLQFYLNMKYLQLLFLLTLFFF